MDNLRLCIDIGNTVTKAGLFQEGIMRDFYSNFSIEDLRSIRETHGNVPIMVARSGKNDALESELDPGQFLTADTPMPMHLEYDTPETLGPDRIAAALGAYAIDSNATWVIVDLGTCLTLDLLHDGRFEGGMISPGIEMRFKAMHQFTSALPRVEFNNKVTFPGKSTTESMQVGVFQSIQYEIQGYVRQLRASFDKVNIVDCSRYSVDFDIAIKNEIFARPNLVLEGLNYLLEQNGK